MREWAFQHETEKSNYGKKKIDMNLKNSMLVNFDMECNV